jgi:glycosyltransferase involved in cell wall biosynthesis
MNPITVCHFSTLTQWGGVERMLVDLLLNVKQNKVRHILLTTSSNPEIIKEVEKSGIKCFQPKGHFRYDPLKFLQMAKWLDSENVKVVHSYGAYASVWAFYSIKLMSKKPVFITGEHGTIWYIKPPLSWADQWANLSANLVIANSESSANLLKKYFNVPEKKIRVVRNAVIRQMNNNSTLRSIIGIGPKEKIVGSVGRLVTKKNYKTFIEAAHLILESRKDIKFLLVGGGPLEDELRAYVAELGIKNNFIITGWRNDAREIISIFDIFVSTSINEPFGNVLIEAALCLKPVIAPRIDGIPEAVIDGETGILLKPTKPIKGEKNSENGSMAKFVSIDGELKTPLALDPRVLAESIIYLIENPDLILEYGKNAKKRAEELFSIQNYIFELEKIYTEFGCSEVE